MDLLCEKEDCDKEATMRYRWPWGDEGVVCDYHATTTQQLAQQLGREPALIPLGPQREEPAPEPELVEQLRTAHASIQELTAALSEAQQQNAALANTNAALRLAARRGAHIGDETTKPE